MQLRILCPQWGSEDLELDQFIEKVKQAGYDGIEAAVPENKTELSRLIRLLEQYDLIMISHQHQANGENFQEFCRSYQYYLELSCATNPLLINSHSGRDWFTLEQQLKILEIAENFASKQDIEVVHETHRGRIGYCPQNMQQIFAQNNAAKITADLSHWVCVTESYLEHFEDILHESINRTVHIHARVGFPEGPQIPDPRLPNWSASVDTFMGWWKRILLQRQAKGIDQTTITCEFGPVPYMWTYADDQPIASQWEINEYMSNLLRARLGGN